MKRTIWTVILLVIIGYFSKQVYVKYQARSVKNVNSAVNREGRAKPAVAVDIDNLTRGTIQDVGSFTGTIIPNEQFTIAPRISGRLRKLNVNIGDMIKSGTLIALLDDEEYAQALQQSKAEVSVGKANVIQAKSSLDNVKREYDRVKGLRAKGISSESEHDSAQARLDAEQAKYTVALAQLEQKEAALKAAEVRHSYTKIDAIWNNGGGGRFIGERFVDEGALLSVNSPIVSVMDLDSVTVIIYVTEKDYTRLRAGQNATVTSDAILNHEFQGTVIRVAPMLRESSRQARVEISVKNDDYLLKPGMFARVKMIFETHKDTLLAPLSAQSKRNGVTGVFLVDNNGKNAKFVPIETGIIEGEKMEILSPEISGRVVILGQHLLEDSSPVIITNGFAENDRQTAEEKKEDKGERSDKRSNP